MQLSLIWVPMEVGLDFSPLRDAAAAVLAGRSVYTDPLFVYPPTAALPMLPFTAGSAVVAFRVWVIVAVGALLIAAAVLARVRPRGNRVAVFAMIATLLVGSAVAGDSLLLGNMSPILVPFAVYVLLSFERDQWTRGCAVLIVSLLIKPLLAPLLLLPAVRRQWRALGLSIGPAIVALLLADLLIPGAARLSTVAKFVLGGTNLHGKNAVNNLSLSGWGEYNHHHDLTLVASVVVAAIGTYALVQWTRFGRGGAGAVQMGTAVLLTVFLAGRISEVHFLLTIMATALLAVMLRPTREVVVTVVVGLTLLTLPHTYFFGLARPGTPLQTTYVVAQLVLLAAAVLAVRPSRLERS